MRESGSPNQAPVRSSRRSVAPPRYGGVASRQRSACEHFDGEESPLGPLVAHAQFEGYSPELRDENEVERGPFHGYYFKILTRQGKHAPGGKYDYVINGNMIAGFAMVAWPTEYGSSGVMTFIVNQEDRVYQKDLGPKTSRLAIKMKTYDPDPSWALSPD